MLVYTTAAFLLFAASAFADCSGFAGSCGPLYVKTGTSGADMVLYATRCSDEQGEFNYNPEIRINDCLANIYGDLKSGTDFAGSCHDFGVEQFTPHEFYATCGDGKGGEKKSTIDLNTVFCNINGNLHCH